MWRLEEEKPELARETTDEVLISRLQRGCSESFEQLVRRWEGPMLDYFYRCTGDMDIAEDLRQELFVRLYLHSASYRGESTFRAWLYAIACNLVRSHLRKARARSWPNDGRAQTAPPDPASSENRTTTDADDLARRSERQRIVRQLLAVLSPADRQALILRFFEGLHYGEIAVALGTAVPTAKSRVYRAIERLRRIAVRRGLSPDELL